MSTSNNTHANSVLSSATTSTSNSHPLPSNSRRSSGSGGGAGGGGGGGGGGSTSPSSTITTTPTPACAACKYQRRKCKPDCTLAPYFPADHQRQFLNARRLFGVSNILNTLKGLDPSQHAAAMNTIIFQSNARAQDPVGGCYRIILELQRQIDRDTTELDFVFRQLALYRAQTQQQNHHHQQPPLPEFNITSTINLIDQNDGPNLITNPNLQQHQQQQQQQYLYYYFGGDEGTDDNNHHQQQPHNNSGSLAMKDHSAGQQYQRLQCEDDDAKPSHMELFDVRHHQAFLAVDDDEDDSKDASPNLVDYSGTARLEMKEEANSVEQVQEHDLKGAASLFKLTNCDLSGV